MISDLKLESVIPAFISCCTIVNGDSRFTGLNGCNFLQNKLVNVVTQLSTRRIYPYFAGCVTLIPTKHMYIKLNFEQNLKGMVLAVAF